MQEKIQAYLAAKSAEEQAIALRVAAEEGIIDLLRDNIPEEGSRAVEADGYKITITQRISRKLDEKAYAVVRHAIPEGLDPIKEAKTFKIEDSGCRWLKENEPGLWQLLASAITEKPQKIGLKVQEVKS